MNTKQKREYEVHEVSCEVCNGAGLLKCNDPATWNSKLCDSCNGYGRLVLGAKKPVAYDASYSRVTASYTRVTRKQA